MIEKELLELLVCPEDHTPLSLADAELVAKLNTAIQNGMIKNRLEQTVEGPLSGGLVREDATLLYPIVDEIPVLVVDEAIPLDQLD